MFLYLLFERANCLCQPLLAGLAVMPFKVVQRHFGTL
jgi:hypothetical protein